ncbi:MAG: hypothetical protein J7M40_03510 [Planctomycetes bacterium]|nr:hypothetical protein [Planctomycetota bacterium]
MKAAKFAVIAAVVAITAAGCEIPENPADPNMSSARFRQDTTTVACVFLPERIRMIGLTEIVSDSGLGGEAVLSIYVDIFDAWDSHIKAPARFRFELYEYVPRSSDSRGNRLMIWPDIDLTDPAVNNSYWHDYLRAYIFDLQMNFKPEPNTTYILEATCTTAQGKRLSNKRQIKYEP